MSHGLQHVGFPEVGLDEAGVQRDARVTVLDHQVEGVELGVARGAVGVDLGVLGVPLQGLGVVLHSVRPVALLEEIIALELLLVRQLGINVSFLFLLLDGSFNLNK